MKQLERQYTHNELSQFLLEAGIQYELNEEFDVFPHSPESSSLTRHDT
jgi:hypothetical protein